MGLFRRSSKDEASVSVKDDASISTGAGSIDKPEPAEPKKSLYQRYEDKKRGKPLSDEDILKYTGKTRDELKGWADERPGVGKNQLAGKLANGPASGFAGAGAAGGLGGWGWEGESGQNRGMKFPPQSPGAEAEQKTLKSEQSPSQ